MTIFVMDASAVLRLLDNEAGRDRVEAIFEEYWDQAGRVEISAVQWGEIAGRVRMKSGLGEQGRAMRRLRELQLRVIDATPERAVHAAELKIDRKISYADAFALDLAMQSPQHLLVTADYGFKAVEDLARIEFLPVK
jgi:PIN domain nuclease of toxin-antitoxin system